MIFCFFNGGKLGVVYGGLVTEVPPSLVPATTRPQDRLVALIEEYEAVKDRLAGLSGESSYPLSEVALEAPVPSPQQLLCAVKNYADDRQGVEADFFLKSPLSIVASGTTVTLPPIDARVFHHEAELAVVIGRGGRDISAADAMHHVFGYTGFLDLSARDVGGTYYVKKSPAGFGPMGPFLVTADEIPDPHDLTVELSVNGDVRQRYSTGQMANRIDRLIELASSVAGVAPGDVIATGTYHLGMGPIQDGDQVTLTIERIGALTVDIADPLHRKWDESGRPMNSGV